MTSFLIILALALGVAVIAQIVRIFELSSELKGGTPNWVVTDRDNRGQGNMMLLFLIAFFAFCLWQLLKYKDLLLPVAASEEGVELDWLMNFNFLIITVVFIICNFFLFYFAFKYKGSKTAKALYYPVNHKLELLWTIIPGIAMAIIIVLGLRSWTKITRDPVAAGEDFITIELVSEQFKWTARYAGDDNKLGFNFYRLITEQNVLGIDSTDAASADDFIVYNEIHIPKGKRVYFSLRSKDVIHSAFFPHFRQQMNTVPGLQTMLHFMPTITTDSMRLITGNPEYNYVLLCNKICGASHFNMQMNIVVDDSVTFWNWYDEKKAKTIFASNMTAPPPGKVDPPAVPDTAGAGSKPDSATTKKP